MSLSDRQHKFGKLFSKLLKFLERSSIKYTIGEVYRPQHMQDWYYEHGYSQTQISQHLKKLAVDMNIFLMVQGHRTPQLRYDKESLQHIGDYWEGLDPDCRWGGNFESFLDTSHFELVG